MIQNIQTAQLFYSVEDESAHKQIKVEMNDLYHLIETYELWQGLEPGTNAAKGLRVAGILAHVRGLVHSPRTNGLWYGGADLFAPDKKMQTMLHNMGFLKLALMLRTAIASNLAMSRRSGADKLGATRRSSDIDVAPFDWQGLLDSTVDDKAGARYLGINKSQMLQAAPSSPRSASQKPVMRSMSPVSPMSPKHADAFKDADDTFARKMMLLNNDVLTWIIHRNSHNQTEAIRHLPLYMHDLVNGVGGPAVIKEMIKDQKELVRLMPPTLVEAVVHRIELDQDPALVQLLAAVVMVNGTVLRENQLRVFQLLVQPKMIPHLFLCSNANGADYALRRELMQKATQRASERSEALTEELVLNEAHSTTSGEARRSAPFDMLNLGWAAVKGIKGTSFGSGGDYAHMDPRLHFHIEVLALLATCAAEKINLVEAKTQAMYPMEDLLAAILDKDTIDDVRLPLIRLWHNTTLDVQVNIPNINSSSRFWDLMDMFTDRVQRLIKLLPALGGLGPATTAMEFWATRESSAFELAGGWRAVRNNNMLVFNEIAPVLEVYAVKYFSMKEVVDSGVRTREQVQAFFHDTVASFTAIYTAQLPCMSLAQSKTLWSAASRMAVVARIKQPPQVPFNEASVDGASPESSDESHSTEASPFSKLKLRRVFRDSGTLS